MTTFDERERAFENMFVHDEEVRFRVRARRNKALAAWACGLLGKTGPVATAYEDEIVASALSSDDAALTERVASDLVAAGRTVTETQVRAEMDRLGAAALAQERAA